MTACTPCMPPRCTHAMRRDSLSASSGWRSPILLVERGRSRRGERPSGRPRRRSARAHLVASCGQSAGALRAMAPVHRLLSVRATCRWRARRALAQGSTMLNPPSKPPRSYASPYVAVPLRGQTQHSSRKLPACCRTTRPRAWQAWSGSRALQTRRGEQPRRSRYQAIGDGRRRKTRHQDQGHTRQTTTSMHVRACSALGQAPSSRQRVHG